MRRKEVRYRVGSQLLLRSPAAVNTDAATVTRSKDTMPPTAPPIIWTVSAKRGGEVEWLGKESGVCMRACRATQTEIKESSRCVTAVIYEHTTTKLGHEENQFYIEYIKRGILAKKIYCQWRRASVLRIISDSWRAGIVHERVILQHLLDFHQVRHDYAPVHESSCE